VSASSPTELTHMSITLFAGSNICIGCTRAQFWSVALHDTIMDQRRSAWELNLDKTQVTVTTATPDFNHVKLHPFNGFFPGQPG